MEEAGGLPVLRWPALQATGVVDAVVTTRWGGVSSGPYVSLNLGLHVGDDPELVVENRRRAAGALGLGLDDLVFAHQVHGRGVTQVGVRDRGRRSEDPVRDTDALVTVDAGVGLVIMVADCVPLVLVDPEARVLACVHAGWRGTVARVAEAAVACMATLGADPARLEVGVGPAIPAARYQVGEDVVSAAEGAFGSHTKRFVELDGTGRWTFDLCAANVEVLVDAGVRVEQVHVAAVGSDAPDFFSDRAARPCGRFAAIAALRPS
jgi:YfiH family protein